MQAVTDAAMSFACCWSNWQGVRHWFLHPIAPASVPCKVPIWCCLHGTCLGWLLAFCHSGLGVGWPVVGFPSLAWNRGCLGASFGFQALADTFSRLAVGILPLWPWGGVAGRWLPDRGASLELHGAFTDCCLRCELLAGSLSLLRLIRLENVEFVSRSEAPMLLVLKADGLIGQHWSHCSRSIYRAGWNRCCWCPVLPTIWEEAEFGLSSRCKRRRTIWDSTRLYAKRRRHPSELAASNFSEK